MSVERTLVVLGQSSSSWPWEELGFLQLAIYF